MHDLYLILYLSPRGSHLILLLSLERERGCIYFPTSPQTLNSHLQPHEGDDISIRGFLPNGLLSSVIVVVVLPTLSVIQLPPLIVRPRFPENIALQLHSRKYTILG